MSADSTVVTIRAAEERDVPAMAALRAETWGTQQSWVERLEAYRSGRIGAKEALPEFAMYVAEQDGADVGMVAGHRTTRHGCQGELEWIDVTRARQGRGIAGALLRAIAGWFAEHGAPRVCVNVEPENTAARAFYAKCGAVDLKPHWMVWEDMRIVIAAR